MPPPPRGGWDCHVHLFGPPARYPTVLPRRYTPGLATPRDLAAMLERTGLDHAVIVQPTPYGDDHSCLIDGLTAMRGRCAGVASFEGRPQPDDALLHRLRDAGVRGLRAHLLRLETVEARDVQRNAAALARETGWHLELQIGAGQLGLVEEVTGVFAGTIVLDHMARVSLGDVPRLAAIPGTIVKLSGLYRQDDPAGALAVAAALLEAMPRRCLWGSDWPHTPPHPEAPGAPAPVPFRNVDIGAYRDAILVDVDETTCRAIFCDVPASLYGCASDEIMVGPS